jgi:hypothetical protein
MALWMLQAPLAMPTTVSGFRTAVFKPFALIAKMDLGGGGDYAAVLLFKYDFDGCEFSEVRKEIFLYMSVTRCGSVLKSKLSWLLDHRLPLWSGVLQTLCQAPTKFCYGKPKRFVAVFVGTRL